MYILPEHALQQMGKSKAGGTSTLEGGGCVYITHKFCSGLTSPKKSCVYIHMLFDIGEHCVEWTPESGNATAAAQ